MKIDEMARNHRALFECFASSVDYTKVYDREGVYSVQANMGIFPKLALCYELELATYSSFESYFHAIETQIASPYFIFSENDYSVPAGLILKQNGFRIVDEWTFMYIALKDLPKGKKTELRICKVETDLQLQEWIAIVEKTMFHNKQLDVALFKSILKNSHLHLWLGVLNDQPICTALSLMSGSNVGLYMISTLFEFRNRGYGKALTEWVLSDAFSKGATDGVLQATRLGINMYRKIGFVDDGKFLLYWKVGKQYL